MPMFTKISQLVSQYNAKYFDITSEIHVIEDQIRENESVEDPKLIQDLDNLYKEHRQLIYTYADEISNFIFVHFTELKKSDLSAFDLVPISFGTKLLNVLSSSFIKFLIPNRK